MRGSTAGIVVVLAAALAASGHVAALVMPRSAPSTPQRLVAGRGRRWLAASGGGEEVGGGGAGGQGEEEDGQEEDPAEAERIRQFRERLIQRTSQAEDGSYTIASSPSVPAPGTGGSSGDASEGQVAEWCKAVVPGDLRPGCVLVANPAVFCSEDAPSAVLDKVALARSIPRDELDADRCAELLPVVLITELEEPQRGRLGGQAPAYGRCRGLLLGRRTGYLLADLDRDVSGFMIQPLLVGGTEGSQDLCMVHPYAQVRGAKSLTEDGLYVGGDFESAQDLVKEGTGSQFRFKFFIQDTEWGNGALDSEILNTKAWLVAQPSRDLLLKSREREGNKRPKPLWTDIVEYAATAGAEDFAQAQAFLYGSGEGDDQDGGEQSAAEKTTEEEEGGGGAE